MTDFWSSQLRESCMKTIGWRVKVISDLFRILICLFVPLMTAANMGKGYNASKFKLLHRETMLANTKNTPIGSMTYHTKYQHDMQRHEYCVSSESRWKPSLLCSSYLCALCSYNQLPPPFFFFLKGPLVSKYCLCTVFQEYVKHSWVSGQDKRGCNSNPLASESFFMLRFCQVPLPLDFALLSTGQRYKKGEIEIPCLELNAQHRKKRK